MESSLSLPSARHEPDETAPSQRRVQGMVCPKCHRRFDEGKGAPSHCPSDGSFLVRAQDLADASGDTMLGRTLAERFTVVAKLGAGSMGAVYRARQIAVGREVAIKILRTDRAVDDAAKARFLREARANSALQSAHTVTVFDFGLSETGELYLAMELLEGESVGQRLQREKRLAPEAAIDVARQALRSLAEAHAKGIVHRDLKPDNLFFARLVNASGQSDEIVKVLDFGIAKMLGEGAGPLNAVETQAGTVFGTPRYMSPEQAQAKPLDARSDLYSLGVILYHMLAGRPPFTDDDAIIVMARHIKSNPKPFSEVCPEARLAPELERVVFRAMAKDPKQRPDNADQMSQELLEALDRSRAVTSGVRPAAPSGLTGSIRPPPIIMTPPPAAAAGDSLELPAVQAEAAGARPFPTLLAASALALVLALGALGVVLALRSHAAPAVDAPPQPTTTTTAVVHATTTAPSAAPSIDPPTIDVSSLPTAKPASAGTSHGPRTKPSGTAATSAAASAGGRYGILE